MYYEPAKLNWLHPKKNVTQIATTHVRSTEVSADQQFLNVTAMLGADHRRG